MIVGGLTKISTIDWPGKVVAVIFTRGCNFRCPWCQNKSLVIPEMYDPEIPVREIMEYLKSRKNYLDGVVVTGGEPTIQAGLVAFIDNIKRTGLPVKLDTNGSNPAVLKKLLNEKLLDALALDIKAPWEKYPKVVGCPVNIEAIKCSFNLAAESGLPVWFRTTVVPGLHEPEDLAQVKKIAKELTTGHQTARHLFQKYRPWGQIALKKWG